MAASKRELTGPDYVVIALILSLMGGFFWAIRGTTGFGGEQGAILAGLGWAVLWHGFSRLDGTGCQRPYGHALAMTAIAFGIAIGGFTGYGVYTAWVRGLFYLGHSNGSRPVAAWTGYAMLFVCGLHWGGLAGTLLAWCAPRRPLGWQDWLARIAAGIAGMVAAAVIVRFYPQWFLPFYGEGIYSLVANKTCLRAQASLQTIALHVGLFVGFLAFELARRDWRAVGVMLVLSLGFAIPFAAGGYWHTMEELSPNVDWWKNWEMSIGLGGGLAFGLAFWLFNRPDRDHLSRPGTRAEHLVGVAIPLACAALPILAGTWSGLRELHHLDWPEPADISPLSVIGGIALVSLALLPWRRSAAAEGAVSAATPVPAWVLVGALALILLAGYLTSIPPRLGSANQLLLSLYTGYVTLSGALFAWLWHRHR